MRVIVKSLTRKLYDVPERRAKSNAIARKLKREDLNMDVEKMIPIEEPFEKSKGPWKKGKKYPKAVMEATVHQAAKDWGVPKSQARKLIQEKLRSK
jgi:hypothetical protein